MSAPRFEEFENDLNEFFDAQETGSLINLPTKLERRRRIEELEEEKRLREELEEF